MTLRLAALFALLAAIAPPAFASDDIDPSWTGQMQCGVTWQDPKDKDRAWMLSVASDTSNMKLGISDRARRGDPAPPAKDEIRELAPRKAKLEVAGVGGGEVEVTSYPIGEDRMWHDIPLGHVEALDKLPIPLTLTLTVGDAVPMTIEMRDFEGARTYLKRCLAR